MKSFDIPILYLMFNRPEMVKETFSVIKKLQPRYLYLAADGPRLDHPTDIELCQQVRNQVIGSIDWDCDVKKLFREKNLGCGVAISSALDWFFESVEAGIIMEDDCLADLSFFHYAASLLKRYEHTEQVFLISGNSRLPEQNMEADYFYSAIPSVWGWATWRRVWKKYDYEMKQLPTFVAERTIERIFSEKKFQSYWLELFAEIKITKINNWDAQVAFLCFFYGGLTVVPRINLVSNIGMKATNGPRFTLANNTLEVRRYPLKTEADRIYDMKVMKLLSSRYLIFKKVLKRVGVFHRFKKLLSQ